ncbi:MAG: pilus assembly PilX family protein, partial [Gammaproteobacteria bacterium]
AAAQSTSLEERMAGNMRDQDLAFQAAEAGLRAAQTCLSGGGALCTNFTANTNGNFIFTPSAPPAPSTASTPLWEVPGFWDTSSNVNDYTALTGVTIASVAAQPEIIVEQMPPVATPGGNLGSQAYGGGAPSIQYFRITALGTGGDSNATVMLQSMYQP